MRSGSSKSWNGLHVSSSQAWAPGRLPKETINTSTFSRWISSRCWHNCATCSRQGSQPRCRWKTINNQELISAIAAPDHIAELLKIKKESPLLLIEMLSFTYKQTPYEYRRSYCVTDTKTIFREI